MPASVLQRNNQAAFSVCRSRKHSVLERRVLLSHSAQAPFPPLLQVNLGRVGVEGCGCDICSGSEPEGDRGTRVGEQLENYQGEESHGNCLHLLDGQDLGKDHFS